MADPSSRSASQGTATFLDDRELLRCYVRNRAEDAFAELVRRYVSLVYHAAQRQVNGDAHTAEDVTQKVFTLLANKASSLTRHRTLAGWLHTTTRFVASETRRAERRRRAREREAYLMHELTSDTTTDAGWETLRPVIDDALGELNAEDRDAVLLRFFANLPHAEIGVRLNVSENTARMRVERALEKLRASLARHRVTSTAAALALALANQASATVPAGLAGTVTSVALGGATGAVGGFAFGNLLGFMSTTKLTATITAALLLVAALGVATYEIRARRGEEEALAAAISDHDAHTAQLKSLQERLEVMEREIAQLQKNTEEARAATAVRAAADAQSAKLAAADDPVAAGDAFMARHPEVKDALNAYSKARLNFRYGEMFRRLNLTQAQIDRFATILGRVGMGGGSGIDGKALSFRSGEMVSGRDYGAGVAAIFGAGEAGFNKYLEFSRVSEAQELIVKAAGELYFTETPLTPDQADQLVRLIADSRKFARGWQPQQYDWNAVMTRARGILSAPQLAAIANLQAKDRFHQALNAPLPTLPAAASKGGKPSQP